MLKDDKKKRGRPKTDFRIQFDAIASWMIVNKDVCFTLAAINLGILNREHHQFENKRDSMYRRWQKEKELHFLRQQIFLNGRAIAISNPDTPTLGNFDSGNVDEDALRKLGLLDIRISWCRMKEQFRLIRQGARRSL